MTRFQTVFAKAGVAFASVLALNQAVSAAVVYEDSGFTQFSNPQGVEIGDQIKLAGTDRIVTEFKTQFFLSAASGDEGVTVRFYNVGAGNTVGDLIYVSPEKNITKEGFGTIAVSGISVAVNDSFVWTVTFNGVNGTTEQSGLLHSLNSAPAIGSSDDFFWAREGGIFKSKATDGLNDNFNAQVTAVPEPGTWALLLTGVAGLGAFGYRRKS